MDDLGEFLKVVLIAYAIWLAFKSIVTAMAIRDQVHEIKAELDAKIRIVELEVIGQQMFAYDKENNQFLGQGLSEEEVKQSLMKRFPDFIFLLNEEPFTANKEYNLPT
jgi:hypothetical protein